ncbi:MAG: right-handed parallel beta-helix repeat-containing protein, partial [Myxococcales bacterium]|nr:right-handed parallel beta-helix repeat-containing protein [Myxococcales bacterium]
IEAALASNTPATVHVCAGDHTIETVSVRSLDDLTVVGAAGREVTTLRPPNGETVFEVRNTGVLTLEGLTITGATSTTPAITVHDQAQLTVRDGALSDNDTAAILIEGAGATVHIEDSTLNGNWGIETDNLIFPRFGGALTALGSFDLTVESSVFSGNNGSFTGGGMLLDSDTGASVFITGSEFTMNTGQFGAGLTASGAVIVEVQDSSFVSNETGGGAVAAFLGEKKGGGQLTLDGCLLADNSTTAGGGSPALFIAGGTVELIQSTVIQHTTGRSAVRIDSDGGRNEINLLSEDTDWGTPGIDDNKLDIYIHGVSTDREYNYNGIRNFTCDLATCRNG